MRRVKVLVVDDSAFARKVLRQSLTSAAELEVVGTAVDGFDALEKVSLLEPDVVTLDLQMPGLDGLGVLRELAAARSRTRVLIVSVSPEDSELVVQGLQLGAVDLIKKPTALATDRLYEISSELVAKVLSVAAAQPSFETAQSAPLPSAPATRKGVELVVIGTSTGGPQALTRLLSMLPGNLPVPVAIAQHIPVEYTPTLARRLNDTSQLEVVEAWPGLVLRPGLVALARGGSHLALRRDGQGLVAQISVEPLAAPYAPSVDVLFQSAAEVKGRSTLGVVLTGMGNDGLLGAKAIVAAGGRVLTEAEASCVVDGMPRSVREAGLSSGEARIEAMAGEIIRSL